MQIFTIKSNKLFVNTSVLKQLYTHGFDYEYTQIVYGDGWGCSQHTYGFGDGYGSGDHSNQTGDSFLLSLSGTGDGSIYDIYDGFKYGNEEGDGNGTGNLRAPLLFEIMKV